MGQDVVYEGRYFALLLRWSPQPASESLFLPSHYYPILTRHTLLVLVLLPPLCFLNLYFSSLAASCFSEGLRQDAFGVNKDGRGVSLPDGRHI